MTRSEILNRIKSMLSKLDSDPDALTNRRRHPQYDSDIAMYLDHLDIVIQHLKLDAEASKRERNYMMRLMEDEFKPAPPDEDNYTGV